MTDAEIEKALKENAQLDIGFKTGICCYDVLDYIMQLKIEKKQIRERTTKLEGKLENGELLESPCKVGDDIFVIVPYCHRCENDYGDYCSCKNKFKNKLVKMKVNSIRFDKFGYTLTEDFSGSMGSLSLYCSDEEFGDTWFFDKQQAKARLKELEEKVK